MKRRSTNILEFQFSSQTSPIFSNRLCDDSQFKSQAWVTQGSKSFALPTSGRSEHPLIPGLFAEKSVAIVTPCPITGDYTGEVPGESGLCAKVASDCNNPDIMFYTVSSCENRSHVYEGELSRVKNMHKYSRLWANLSGFPPTEREYRCLGNWEEDQVLYTYTQRRDTTGYQCFVRGDPFSHLYRFLNFLVF